MLAVFCRELSSVLCPCRRHFHGYGIFAEAMEGANCQGVVAILQPVLHPPALPVLRVNEDSTSGVA